MTEDDFTGALITSRKVSVEELGRRLVLMVLNWHRIKKARFEDHMKRQELAKAHGVSVESWTLYLSAKRAPGVDPPFHDRPMKVKRGKTKPKKRTSYVEVWDEKAFLE